MSTESQQENTPEIDPIAKKFIDQEAQFVASEKTLAILRDFFKKWREVISAFKWTCYGWGSPDIKFDLTYGDKSQAKAIATAFGKEGWRREKDNYACGKINWLKTVDGVELKIDGAEQLSPKLIEEVKL